MEDQKGDHKDPIDVTSSPNFADEAANPAVLKGAIDPVYEAKAQTLNGAIQDIGQCTRR